MSIAYDMAGHVQLAVEDSDKALQRAVTLQLDPYLPEPLHTSDGVPRVVIEDLGTEVSALHELQRAAGDGFVTGSAGPEFFVLAGNRRASVPDAFHDEPARIRVEAGYPLSGLFRSVVRPALQLRALARGSVAIHAAAVAINGRAVLVAGWSESGKTETALALLEEGARFLSDKWTLLGPDAKAGTPPTGCTAAVFPISVGVRRWALRYLPRLRAGIPARARAQLLMAGAFGAATRPLRGRGQGTLGTIGAGANRLLALADRAALTPSEIARAYGHDPIRGRLPVGLIAVLRTTPDGSVTVRDGNVDLIAARLATSAVAERVGYWALQTRARYALGRAADPNEVAELERVRLHELLCTVPVVEVSAPFPTDPRHTAGAVRSWLDRVR